MLRRLLPRCLLPSLRPRPFPSASLPRLTARLISHRGTRAVDIEHQLMQVQERQRKRADHKAARPIKKKRGFKHDRPTVRTSKTISWVLRHGAQEQGLYMRPDGYVRVEDLLALEVLSDLDFAGLQSIVEHDAKQRYSMVYEPDETVQGTPDVWWIRANQGHSIEAVSDLELKVITSVDDIPSKIAVHGTTRQAWEIIRTEGLSKMKRNHIHLAQGVPKDSVMSGIRNSSQIMIYINVERALAAGIKFYLSSNGVVLTEGDEHGYLKPEFFERVVTPDGQPVPDWHPLPIADIAIADPILDPLPLPGPSEPASKEVDEIQKETQTSTL